MRTNEPQMYRAATSFFLPKERKKEKERQREEGIKCTKNRDKAIPHVSPEYCDIDNRAGLARSALNRYSPA